MRQLPKSGEIYKHFKGNCYRIIALAEHTETGETLVIYQALYGENKIYARELSMFMSPVDRKKYPDVQQEMRFEILGTEPVPEGEKDAVTDGKLVTDTEAGKKVSDSMTENPSGLDEGLLAFLDADSSKERLQILTSMKDRLTDSIINTMAIAVDVELRPGDMTEKYEELKYCLATKERFECRRLR